MMIYLGISGPTVFCRSDSPEPGWTIRICDIVLIAEYTTDEGPADDYFLVFVTREEGELYYSSVTMSAAGINAVLEELEKQLGFSLELKLASITKWASNVLWPSRLAGAQYLEPVPMPPPQNLRERIARKVKGVRPSYSVSQSLLRELSAIRPSE